jgi:hypothetical protein
LPGTIAEYYAEEYKILQNTAEILQSTTGMLQEKITDYGRVLQRITQHYYTNTTGYGRILQSTTGLSTENYRSTTAHHRTTTGVCSMLQTATGMPQSIKKIREYYMSTA